MSKTVTLRDANQNFARYVREAAGGEEFIITRRGQPVARLVPVGVRKRVPTPEQEAALARILATKGCSPPGWRFSREEIYDERIDELERRRASKLNER
jgi:prevent-host-death family protein